MAVVLTSLLTTFSRTVFIKPPDAQRGLTAMPRALVNFSILDGVVDAKPLNDQHDLVISILLPREFAYRLIDRTMTLFQDKADDWLPFGYLEVTNGVRSLEGGATQRHTIAIDLGLRRVPASGILSMWQAGRRDPVRPTYVIQALDGSAPVVTVKMKNQGSAAAAAGTFDCLFTFLEYDIEQAQLFPVHWPVLTYAR